MKKLSLFALVLTVTFASCGKLDMDLIDNIVSATKTTISADELPDNTIATLDNDYFDTYIDEALMANGLGYQVNLSNGLEIFFDKDGESLNCEGKRKGKKKGKKKEKGYNKGEKIDTADLSNAVKTYISTNYPDVTIERAKINHNNQFMVKVSGDLILVFDADGNFIKEYEFVNRHGFDGSQIDITTLPTLVTDYVTGNYTNATVKVAFLKEGKYFVGLTTDTGKKMVIFDSEGIFIEEKTCNG
jgi:hypothetical protein